MIPVISAPASRQPSVLRIIGGGVPALMTAIDVSELAHRLGLEVIVEIYEAEAFGGGRHEFVASSRCQLWLHRDGQLYVLDQPSVVRSLQRSTARLRALVPYAFDDPFAIVIDQPDGHRPYLDRFYRALNIPFHPIDMGVIQHWPAFSRAQFEDHAQAYGVRDGTMDLRLLSYGLSRRAAALGVRMIRQRVTHVDVAGDSVRRLVLANGETASVQPFDHTILACGPSVRPLLATAGVTIPGLRLFQSQLVATPALQIPFMFLAHRKLHCVPHRSADGRLINIVANLHRAEISSNCDNQHLIVDEVAVEGICRDTYAILGMKIPRDARYAWAAVKMEFVQDGAWSQSHHACVVPGLQRVWLALPGKLSQSAGLSWDLARQILRSFLDDTVACSIWEQPVEAANLEGAACAA